MKRFLCLTLIFTMFLSGCGIPGERIKEPVSFYYVRETYQKDMGEVILSEQREAAGHKSDLPYLLALYSMGPTTEGLTSPFPPNTKIIPTEHTKSGIVLSISENAETMTDAQYTLASACLAMTCMELTHTPQITVVCEDRSVTIDPDNLITYVSMEPTQMEESQ